MSADPAYLVWQMKYAARGVALFPVTIDGDVKKPAIRGWQRMGLNASDQLVIKFPYAPSFGFVCGARNRITVVDIDSPDEAIVRDAERLFGPSPLLWRTGSGKFAMPFRHNGEARKIRPIPSLPIDLLGGGLCVAPPSLGAKRPYEIIRGNLSDLDRLPIANIPHEIGRQSLQIARDRVPEGRRNGELFKYCQRIVGYCDDQDQLIDAARTWAADRLAAPLPDAEIVKTSASVWRYRGGRKRIMNGSFISAEQALALEKSPHGLALLAWLSMHNGPQAHFYVANGLANTLDWPRRMIQDGRKALVDTGIIRCIKRRSPGTPALYCWAIPDE